VYGKASGALATDGKKQRLLRVWGHLEEDSIRMPARIVIDGKTISTDRHGWYETWLAVGADEADEVAFVPTDLKMKNLPKRCTGWFDMGGIQVPFKATDHELQVSWTPQPDCCDD
jgi:hypothetical protein